jgi:hypothetical protein
VTQQIERQGPIIDFSVLSEWLGARGSTPTSAPHASSSGSSWRAQPAPGNPQAGQSLNRGLQRHPQEEQARRFKSDFNRMVIQTLVDPRADTDLLRNLVIALSQGVI